MQLKSDLEDIIMLGDAKYKAFISEYEAMWTYQDARDMAGVLLAFTPDNVVKRMSPSKVSAMYKFANVQKEKI